jgi:hypothetical protein
MTDAATAGGKAAADAAIILDALSLVSYLATFARRQLALSPSKKQADRIAGLFRPGGEAIVKNVRQMSLWPGEGGVLVAQVVRAAEVCFGECRSMLHQYRMIPDEGVLAARAAAMQGIVQ